MNPFVTLLRRSLAGVALLGLAAGAAPHAHAAFITVNAFDDVEDDANGDCTLREAVAAANTDTAVDGCAAGSGTDVIIFAPGATNPTITLGGTELLVSDDLSVEGQNGANSQVTVDAAASSRHFRVGFNTSFDASNLVLVNGLSALGGSVRYNVGTSGVLTDVVFNSNVAGVSGGAVYNGGDLVVSGGTFFNNLALGETPADGGGAVYNRGTLAVTAGALFASNRAATPGAGNGGALYNFRRGTLTIDASGGAVIFDDNQAGRAGGAIESAGLLTMEGAAFAGNQAGVNGGALHMSGTAQTTVLGGSVDQNAAQIEGGGFWNSANGRLAVDGTSFTGNSAAGSDGDQGGGAIYSDGGDLAVRNATFDGNTATGSSGSGGGILSKEADLNVSASMFMNNTANRAGGAIEAAGGDVSIAGVSFQQNVAGRAPGNGGGIHAGGSATLNIDGASFEMNEATEGGGVWISGGTTAFVVGNSTFTGNSARGDASSQGGGGFYSDGGEAFLTDATFTDNLATGLEGSGGGINIQGGNFVFNGGEVTGNEANRAGGGIEIAGGIAVIEDVAITGNRAGVETGDSDDDSNAAPGYGGGVHGGGSANVTVILATVTGNRAVQGGGLWNGGFSEMNVRRSAIASNRAESGAGLYQAGGLNGTGLLTVRQSLVAINIAANRGGGIATRKGSVEIVNTSLSGNFARNGGGVSILNGAASFLNATIANNSASNRGGGVYTNDRRRGVDPTIFFSNTIAADNAAPEGDDVFGNVGSEGYNLVEQPMRAPRLLDDPTNIIGQDPLLGPPADNGGPTFTHALLPGSPAIDAGQSSVAVDQRGYGRPVGADDIGAFEFGATPIVENPEVATSKTGDALAGIGVATPNPFRSTSTISLAVEATEAVRVVLYDALGREVQTVFDGVVTAGVPVEAQIDGRGLATGVYVVRVTGDTFATTQQVTIVR